MSAAAPPTRPATRPATTPAATPTTRLRRRLVWVGAAVILASVLIGSYETSQDYRVAQQQAQRALSLLDRTLAEATGQMLREIDFATGDVARTLADARGAAREPEAIRAVLQERLLRLPSIHSAAVFRADGSLWTSTDPLARPGLSISDRPVFAVPATARDDVLYVDSLRMSRRDGYRTFALSRRIGTPEGGLQGVLVVRVAEEYLQRIYETVEVRRGTQLVLARQGGDAIARYPAEERPATPGGRLVESRPVPGVPLTLEVNQPVEDALAVWRDLRRASALRTLALSVVAALLLIALERALRGSERADLARRESEVKLQEARRAEALSLLAASVAHDFNNVLSAILGYGELARADASTGPVVRGHLDRLLAAAERARKLVRRVLTFDPNRSLDPEFIALATVIREVVEQLEPVRPAAVTLEVDVQDATLGVQGDATELHQVLMNLCTNGIRAMPDGGRLHIALGSQTLSAPRVLAVGALEPGAWLCLSVADQGIGIAAEQVQSIFDPLYTTPHAGNVTGTGIGLTVVRNIVTAMGGGIDVTPVPTGGVRFDVWLRAAAPPATAGQPVAARRPGSGQTLLIVDDEPQLVALMEEMAASLGYEAVGFSDAQRALDAVRRDPQRFDAVLTDERMPGMRGAELARALRLLRPDLKVVLVTGYRDTDIEAEARASGIVAILDKPLQSRELARALQGLLSTGH